jgi:peptidoglycan/xylan/chitin deacetylase (PgdA/CDA1 family)
MKRYWVFLLFAGLVLLCSCGKETADVFAVSPPLATATPRPITLETIPPSPTPYIPAQTETPIPVRSDDLTQGAGAPSPEPSPTPRPDYSLTKPYEAGQIMIVMYHGITPDDAPNPPYHRTVSEFKSDMQALYDRGYRLASLKDVMSGNIKTAAGYTPVVFTFDDGLASSFSLREHNGRLVPVENTAFALMRDFYVRNPGFGFSATFFINNNTAFPGAGSFIERLEYLIDHGCDIGNHSYNHESFRTLTADELQAAIGTVDGIIRDALPGYSPVGVSYPLGIRPSDADLYPFVLNGSYNGRAYTYDFALREGQSGDHATFFRNGFNPYNVPRVRASDNETTDLWWTIRFYDDNPIHRYISDGCPNTVVVPDVYSHNLDADKIEHFGKELIVY